MILNNISNDVARWLKSKNEEETASIEVMAYSLNILLNTISIIILSLLLGYVFNIFIETLISLLSFAFLRAFSGGAHVKSSELCVVISTGLMLSIAAVSNYLTVNSVYIMGVISIAILFIFAPAKVRGQTRIPESLFPLLKILCVVIVGLNFIIMSEVLALSFLIQSITTIKLGKEVKAHETVR